ncbi:MAG TPA: RDD family protein [Acidimicrobiales bacterium]|nr:RDD family protein [Acidimicrobiales bacterium]
MDYEDRMSIATPEGVELDLTLAGVGSRFVASFLDQVVQAAVLLALALAATFAGVAGGGGGGAGAGAGAGGGGGAGAGGGSVALAAVAGIALLAFAVQFGYHVLFETMASGRTPGKRWTGLRVVTTGGGPVGFLTSVVRNLLRIVDILPGFYGVAIVSVLVSRRNQRLGDLAAGTLVVRELSGSRRRGRLRLWRKVPRTVRRIPPPPTHDLDTWDVSSVTAEELATVRRFLERRPTLTLASRIRLGNDLALRLRPKVVGPPDDMDPELFLEELVAAKAARS